MSSLTFNPSTPYPALSPSFRDATIGMEDRDFYAHSGFDFAAMHRALRANVQSGRVIQGGSTITQQLAKNLFLDSERTLGRKVREAFYTAALERRFSKDQILSLYVGEIDYGMGQRGVRNAARYYFGTTPDKLTLAQSAVLVGLVPRPPQYWLDEESLEKGRQKALDRISGLREGRYSPEQIDAARAEPLGDVVPAFVTPEEREATQTVPATFHGVSCFFFAEPESPLPVPRVAPLLRDRVGAFLEAARRECGVVGIDHVGVYNDRFQRGSDVTVSAHAYGQAIDISGFRFADGTRVSVEDHDRWGAGERARVAKLRVLLSRHFDRVLDWENEPVHHQEHFHAEVRAARPCGGAAGARVLPPAETGGDNR